MVETGQGKWTELIRDYQNRSKGMKIDERCQLCDITKASCYWRLRKVREVYLATSDNTQVFVGGSSSAILQETMTLEYKIAAVITLPIKTME